MNGPYLESGTLTEFQPLGAGGETLFRSAPELRAAIARRLGAEIAASLAIPQQNARGDTLDWYAPEPGQVVQWEALPEDQRGPIGIQVEQLQAEIAALAETLISEESGERQTFGRLLEHAATIPDASHIFLVDDRPVLAFWGFRSRGGDPVAPLFPGQGPIHLATDPSSMSSRKGSGSSQSELEPGPWRVNALKDRISRPLWWLLAAIAVVSLLITLLLPGTNHLPPTNPKHSSEILIIPSQAVETGSTRFLTGTWRASGDDLVDTETKLPIVLAFLLDEGSGEVQVTERDGSICRAPVDAVFDGDTLSFMPRTAIFCENREAFYGITVTCRPSTDRRADCTGTFPDGSSVRVKLRKNNLGAEPGHSPAF